MFVLVVGTAKNIFGGVRSAIAYGLDMMGKISLLYINDFYDRAPFMSEVTQLLEDILGRPVYDTEDWRRLITEARAELKRMRDASVADQPLKKVSKNTIGIPLDKWHKMC